MTPARKGTKDASEMSLAILGRPYAKDAVMGNVGRQQAIDEGHRQQPMMATRPTGAAVVAEVHEICRKVWTGESSDDSLERHEIRPFSDISDRDWAAYNRDCPDRIPVADSMPMPSLASTLIAQSPSKASMILIAHSPLAAIQCTIPGLRLDNPLNGSQGTSRKAMFAAATRRKKTRAQAMWHVRAAMTPTWLRVAWREIHVTITRVSPGKLDGDNLEAACKSVRDGVADALGFKDDSDERLHWHCAQERGQRKSKYRSISKYGVKIRIEAR